MNTPGTRSRDKKPAAGATDKKAAKQSLRVMSEDGSVRAAPSIAMPRAKTELTALLAGDKLLCVRRPPAAPTRSENTEGRPGARGASGPCGSDAPSAPTVDQDLSLVIDAWPDLPRSVRAAVLAMIRETD